MPAGITDSDSMFSVRETPWHGLGAVLDTPPATVGEAIEASGLGWSVSEGAHRDRPRRHADGRLVGIRVVRRSPATTPPSGRTTATVLGIVGERYRIVQNHEAFAFVDQLLGSSPPLRDGRKPERRPARVGARHATRACRGRWRPSRPYVLMMNSHDGSTAVIAATTPVRVVCQNTLNWGLQGAAEVLDPPHGADQPRVHEARRVLDLSINYYEQFKRHRRRARLRTLHRATAASGPR